MLRSIILFCLTLTAASLGGVQANPFKTAISVNGVGISHYEIDQRSRLLRAIETPGDLQAKAKEALVSEALFLEEAHRLNFSVTDEELETGIIEFAARASMDANQFLEAIATFGVTKESFDVFVRAGIAWRKVISERFSSEVEKINILDVERALAFEPAPTITTVRLSEIALSLRPSAAERSRQLADQIYRSVTSAAEFAEVARSLSVADSQPDGGAIGWVPLSRLPSNVSSAIQVTSVGRMTPPIEAQTAIFLFFKHEIREEKGTLSPAVVEYAILRAAPTGERSARQQAMAVLARVDTCDDLRSVSREFPSGYYRQNFVEDKDNATAYSISLARLDSHESVILPIANSDAVEILMLCNRRSSLPDEQREPVLNQKRNEKLEDYASHYLDNLRATAIITEN